MASIQILVKPASGLCNLKCRYCFYCDEMEKRETPSYGFMAEETMEAVIRRAFAYADERVGFLFQGGEPTLVGLDFYKAVVALEEKYNRKKIPVTNSIQTNGMNLTAEWASFFASHDFLVGISIDGTKHTHDAFRVDAAGTGTFASVMKTAEIFEQYGVTYNVLTVVNKRTAVSIPKIYSFYKKNNWKYLQFIPCLDPVGEEAGTRAYSLTPEDYGQFLCRLFELWYQDLLEGKQPFIRQFENYIAILMGLPAESCDMCGGCTIQFVTEADGSVYPCDFYVMDDWKMGNFLDDSVEELLASEKAKSFIMDRVGERSACRGCRYYYLCRGGCKRHWSEKQNYFCSSYKMFFEAALPRMQEIAARLLHSNSKCF